MAASDEREGAIIAGPYYDTIPEHAKVGGVWGAMRTAARDAYRAGRAEAAAERTREVVAKLREARRAWAFECRIAALIIRMAYPDAFPAPKPEADDAG